MYAEMKQQETGPRWEYYNNEWGYEIRKNVLEMIAGRILEVLKSSLLKFFIICEKSSSAKYRSNSYMKQMLQKKLLKMCTFFDQ